MESVSIEGDASPLLQPSAGCRPARCVALLFSSGHRTSRLHGGGLPLLEKVVWPAMLALAGCASVPGSVPGPGDDRAERQFRREDARLAAYEKYERQKDACQKSGGIVIVPRAQGRFGLRTSDMRAATCSGRSSIGQ